MNPSYPTVDQVRRYKALADLYGIPFTPNGSGPQGALRQLEKLYHGIKEKERELFGENHENILS